MIKYVRVGGCFGTYRRRLSCLFVQDPVCISRGQRSWVCGFIALTSHRENKQLTVITTKSTAIVRSPVNHPVALSHVTWTRRRYLRQLECLLDGIVVINHLQRRLDNAFGTYALHVRDAERPIRSLDHTCRANFLQGA